MTKLSVAYLFFVVALITSEISSQDLIIEQPVPCQQQCHKVCEDHCEKPILCKEGQIECGEEPQKKSGLCSLHKICVDEDCECPVSGKDGSKCDAYCPVECKEEQTRCPGNLDANMCPEPDSCIVKTDSCAGYCPLECNDQHKLCPCQEDCPEKGKGTAPYCLAIETGKNGVDCEVFCPCNPECLTEAEHCCVGGLDLNGCKTEDVIVKRQMDEKGEFCPGICPVECEAGEILCQGPTQCNGCIDANTCRPEATNVNGEACNLSSASHECPIHCCEHEYLCPGIEDKVGCKTEDLCLEKTKDKDGEYCTIESVCSPCKIDDVSCPQGWFDNGCEKPPLCITPPGNDCPVHCPIECGENQIQCGPYLDEEGCEKQDVCIDKVPCEEPCPNECWCPAFCPWECETNKLKCPIQRDCQGCPMEQTCVIPALSSDGEQCPDNSASHHCPILCDEEKGEVLCPAGDDSNFPGCKGEALCLARPIVPGTDPVNLCPAHSICPRHCGLNELVCSTGLDLNGCKNEDVCVPIGTMWDGLTRCETECPPVCNEDQNFCPGELMCNGCLDASTCQDKVVGVDGAYCPAACPLYCEPEKDYVEGEPDEKGCPTRGYCATRKVVGDVWTHVGGCEGAPDHPECGEGTQAQSRECTDGTNDICTPQDTERVVSCAVAGTALPKCVEPTATTCPDGFDLVEGGCYKMSADKATFEKARASCQSLEGDYDLAILNSVALANHFAGVVKEDCWIGLHDLNQEEKFEWVDGTLSKFTVGEAPWESGEPNDWGGGEDCVHYKAKNGKWNDNKCSREIKYICGPLPTPKVPECQERTKAQNCYEIRDRGTCLVTNDPRTDYAGPCGWCGDKCGNDNVCEPVVWLNSNSVTDFEDCLKEGETTTTTTTTTTAKGCNTNGGSHPNVPCVFPFIYKGTTYNECTDVDNNGVSWCATTTVCVNAPYFGCLPTYVPTYTGNCEDGCPGV